LQGFGKEAPKQVVHGAELTLTSPFSFRQLPKSILHLYVTSIHCLILAILGQ